jgi:hypothetical protein
MTTLLNTSQYHRTRIYYEICRNRSNVNYFIDKPYLCLCTKERYANCMEFNYTQNFQCKPNNHCANQGKCLQDHPTCPSIKIRLFPNCFFGNKCQFYAKGLGSTSDEILGYEFKRDNSYVFKKEISRSWLWNISSHFINCFIMFYHFIYNEILVSFSFTSRSFG